MSQPYSRQVANEVVTASQPHRVLCDGHVVAELPTREDAEDMANGWNAAYPPPLYPGFTVEAAP